LIEIRQLFQQSEFVEVVRLQKTIWSFPDVELLPVRFLVVVSRVGGHVFGAFDGSEMIGFCFAIPGIKPGGRSYRRYRPSWPRLRNRCCKNRYRAVLGTGTILNRSTPVYDVARGAVLTATEEQPLVIPEKAVVVAGSRPISRGRGKEWGLSLYAPVIVKYRDAKTDLRTQLEDLLR